MLKCSKVSSRQTFVWFFSLLKIKLKYIFETQKNKVNIFTKIKIIRRMKILILFEFKIKIINYSLNKVCVIVFNFLGLYYFVYRKLNSCD